MKKFIVGMILALCVVGCTNTDAANSALLDEGFTHIEMTGWQWGCDKNDSTCDGFNAIGPTGRHVQGVVGCGFNWVFSKACTVRISH